jgi:glycosyltransferase involved in cell wall biosynthesis
VSRGIRFLWQANSPHVGSGYGVQSRHILPALRSMPEVEDIVIFAFYGLQGGRLPYRMGKHTFQMVPTTVEDWGNSAVSNYALEFRSDFVVTLMDIWPLAMDYGTGFRWVPYMPIDCETPDGKIPPAFTDRLVNAYLPIVYAQYADRKLDDLGYEHVYAPHGAPADVYRPLTGMKRRLRALFDMPEGARNGYVFGMVAANKGNPPRKGFPEAFEAFGRLLASGTDAWLYLHTVADSSQGGPDLRLMAQAYGIADRLIISNQHLLLSGAYDEQDMARLFNTFDCLLAPSYSEGFGIPLVEAQCCGVPVITTDAFAMTELCGSGWLVPADHRLYVPLGAAYVMPSVQGITDAMLEATRLSAAGQKHYREEARAFGVQYDWPTVVDRYWKPIMRRLHREIVPRTYRLQPVERANGHEVAVPTRELVSA